MLLFFDHVSREAIKCNSIVHKNEMLRGICAVLDIHKNNKEKTSVFTCSRHIKLIAYQSDGKRSSRNYAICSFISFRSISNVKHLKRALLTSKWPDTQQTQTEIPCNFHCANRICSTHSIGMLKINTDFFPLAHSLSCLFLCFNWENINSMDCVQWLQCKQFTMKCDLLVSSHFAASIQTVCYDITVVICIVIDAYRYTNIYWTL